MGTKITAWAKKITVYLLLAVAIGWSVDYWRAQSMVSGSAPALVATGIAGEAIDLLSLSQEKPVLVYFWATWCGVCSTVSPSVDFISAHYQVISVVLSSGEQQRIEQYLSGREYSFSTINDPKARIAREWGVSLTPTLFVIEKGQIKSVTTGFTSPIGMWLRLLMA
jgi:thiol-disulfide isomerase/thioredoxin